MKQTTKELCEETIAARVENLVNLREYNVSPEERRANNDLNERMDHWMKEITAEQKAAIENCIEDMLEWNGICQAYLYEEGVKDGIRLMKMIHEL